MMLGEAMELIGALIIAYIVLSVHMHILKERSIDADVLSSMKKERVYVYFGIALLVIGFIIESTVRYSYLGI